MVKLVVKQATGVNLEEAAKSIGFEFPLKYNASILYKKDSGNNGFDVKAFANSYVNGKMKGIVNVGGYVVLESSKEDSRLRPYKVTNVSNKGTRKFKSVYQLFQVENVDGKEKLTNFLGQEDTKPLAVDLAKKLVKHANGAIQDIEVVVGKEVVVGEKVAARVTYTPSQGTKEGSYIFFALEEIKED